MRKFLLAIISSLFLLILSGCSSSIKVSEMGVPATNKGYALFYSNPSRAAIWYLAECDIIQGSGSARKDIGRVSEWKGGWPAEYYGRSVSGITGINKFVLDIHSLVTNRSEAHFFIYGEIKENENLAVQWASAERLIPIDVPLYQNKITPVKISYIKYPLTPSKIQQIKLDPNSIRKIITDKEEADKIAKKYAAVKNYKVYRVKIEIENPVEPGWEPPFVETSNAY